jgi:lipoprotein NlpD
MIGKRFDRAIMVSVAGAWLALAMTGCANVGQQGAQGDAASVPGAANVAGTAGPSASANTPAAAGANEASPLKKAPPLVYRVKRGDTLARIAQRHHCSVGQLQAWNGLKASSRLKRGQVLRVASPETVQAVNAAATAAKATASASSVSAAQTSVADGAAAGSSSAAQASAGPSAAEAREVAQQTMRHANGVALAWPAGGRVVEAFQPGETRGIEIGGKPGDPVRAAADGKVMYAGTGLNSYGSLIIVQHNKDFLTAYSHNRKLLVKTGDIVRQGQQIAEMGDQNNSRVSVGFELRRDGKPIDPMPYLPQGRG